MRKVSRPVSEGTRISLKSPVRDLLDSNSTETLKVREHPSFGPYVEGLSRLVVGDNAEMMVLMEEGTQLRTVAATQMNATSSRSHAIFQITLTQRRLDPVTQMTAEKVSKISLVDLAGSERANRTGASGSRLKEGAQINKSLTTLGKCVQALASRSSKAGRNKRDDFVPYRDSTLTWLLKESLGGNSKTTIIAAISPTDYDETLSTLRYADQAKQIRTNAVVNEDPNARMIRELREELDILRKKAASSGASTDPTLPADQQLITYETKDGELRTVTRTELQEALAMNEKLTATLNETWEERLRKTTKVHLDREKALAEMGISVDKAVVGFHAPTRFPHLVNLNEDPFVAECLVYQLVASRTTIGSLANPSATIKLSGPRIAYEHCHIDIDGESVSLTALDEGMTLVNGRIVQGGSTVSLQSGSRVILDVHVFRFVAPEAARRKREESSAKSRTSTPEGPIDWSFAKREAALAWLSAPGADLDNVDDDVLDSIFDDLIKARSKRRPDSRLSVSGDTTEPLSSDTTSMEARPSTTVDGIPAVHRSPHHRRLSRRAISECSSVDEDQKVLEAQTRALDNEIKRLRHHAAQASLSRRSQQSVLTILTARERALAVDVIAKWRSLKTFAMAERLLTSAKAIREANLLAMQRNIPCRYDFAITPATDDEAVDVAVSIIDGDAFYTWPLHEFNRRLLTMRAISNHHFDHSHCFRDVEPPSQALIGSTLFSLSGCLQEASHMTLPIVDLQTGQDLGTCKIHLILSTLGGAPAELSFCLDDVCGFDSNYFFEVCAKIRLSSLIGPVEADEIITSATISLDTSYAVHLAIRRNLKFILDADRQEFLRTALAEVQFFCKPTPQYLNHLKAIPRPKRQHPQSAPSPPAHALLTHLQLEELGADGEWKPVECHQNGSGSPVFHIHQGLQRRVRLDVQHHSAGSLTFEEIGTVSISHVRSEGKLESDIVVELQPMTKIVSGTEAQCTSLWDSAAHLCHCLNRVSGAPVTLRLAFLLDLNESSDPAMIEFDFVCKVLARDAGPSSSLFGFLRSSTISDRQSETHSIALKPIRTRDPHSLWQFDTSHEPLLGDADLNGWVPRGIEMINEHQRTRAMQVKHAHLEAVRQRLRRFVAPPDPPAVTTERWRSLVQAWQSFVQDHGPTQIRAERSEEGRSGRQIGGLVPEARSARTPVVTRIDAL